MDIVDRHIMPAHAQAVRSVLRKADQNERDTGSHVHVAAEKWGIITTSDFDKVLLTLTSGTTIFEMELDRKTLKSMKLQFEKTAAGLRQLANLPIKFEGAPVG